MRVTAWFVRRDTRGRWRSLLLLTGLVAFAVATVVVAVAGARRGSSAVDRLVSRTLVADAAALPNEPGFDWEAVRELPDVEALTTFVVGGYGIAEVPNDRWEDVVAFPPADAEVMNTIERPVVLDGRVADPQRADEVVVTSRFPHNFGRGVGDTVTLELYSPEQIDASVREGNDPGTPEGPEVKATIVGIVRSPWYGEPSGHPGAVVPSPGLFKQYEANFLGNERGQYINALVRLRDGDSGIPRFEEELAALTGRTDIDVWHLAESVDHERDVTRFESNVLLAFALAAALAAAFLLGQAISRYVAAGFTDLRQCRALGATRAQVLVSAAAGPTGAAIVGSGVASVAAVVASRWFPIGSASAFEPAPGIDVDVPVLTVAAVLVPLAVALTTVITAWLGTRRVTTHRRRARGSVVDRVAGGPVPVTIGARFALDPGQGQRALPVRPALAGAVIGVAGIVAALTFAAAVDDATSHMDRFGQTFDLVGFLGYNDADFSGPETLGAIAGDPDVAAVDDARTDVARVGDASVSVFTYDPVDTFETVVTRGRMPTAVGEVVLGPRTADALDANVGDRIEISGPNGSLPVTITGIGFVAIGPHNDYASGAWAIPATYDALFDGFKFHFALVTLRPGSDPEVVAAGFAEDDIFLGPGFVPVEMLELREIRVMPLLLAAFLLVLGVGAVGHALATTVRRRRHDLAVLRALGMTRLGARVALLTQATIIAVVGAVLGIPIGLAIGRTVWAFVAERTPVAYLAPTAWLVLALAAPIAVIAANALAAWPSRRAAKLPVGPALRTE